MNRNYPIKKAITQTIKICFCLTASALCFSFATLLTLGVVVLLHAAVSQAATVLALNHVLSHITQADVRFLFLWVAAAFLFFEIGFLMFWSFFKTKNHNDNNHSNDGND